MSRILLIALLLVVGACTGAEQTPEAEGTGVFTEPTTEPLETETATETTRTPSPTTTGDATAAMVDTAAFCDALVEAEMTVNMGPDVDFENSTQEEIEAAMSDFADVVEPALQAVEEQVPEDISEQVSTVIDLIRQGLETGEDPFSSPEFQQADQEIDDWVRDNCDIQVQDVSAVDYAYEGVPSSMPAGQVGFQMDNEGDEVHEFALVRKREGVEESFQEILETDDQSKVEFAGAAFAAPGSTDTFYTDLQPGEYLAVCFIPIGATSMEVLENAESTEPPSGSPPELGPPHFTQGMTAEFTVE